jgi:hypothetical protein
MGFSLSASVSIELFDPPSVVYLDIIVSSVSSGMAIPLALATLIPSVNIERATSWAVADVAIKSLVLSCVKAVNEFLSHRNQYTRAREGYI